MLEDTVDPHLSLLFNRQGQIRVAQGKLGFGTYATCLQVMDPMTQAEFAVKVAKAEKSADILGGLRKTKSFGRPSIMRFSAAHTDENNEFVV